MLHRIERLKKEIEQRTIKYERAQGVLEANLARLHEKGYKDVDEAEEALESLRIKRQQQEEELAELLDQIEEDLA